MAHPMRDAAPVIGVKLACVAGRRMGRKGSKGAREYRGEGGGNGRPLPSRASRARFVRLSLPFGRPDACHAGCILRRA